MSTNPDRRHEVIDLDVAALAAVKWNALGVELHAIVEAINTKRNLRHWEDGADAVPDGFPTTASGGNAGGGRSGSSVSVVERTAAARVRKRHDPIGAMLAAAIADLEACANHARGVRVKLDRIADARDADGLKPTEPGCWAMERVGGWEPVHARMTLNGSTYGLGRWAYDFARKHGVMPSEAQCRARQAGKKVFVPAPKAAKR